MNFKVGGQTLINNQIPLLWGTRAVLQDKQGRTSIIDLSGDVAKPEIVGDEPAPETEFVPTLDGYTILSNGQELYSFNPKKYSLISISLGLPDCIVSPKETIVQGVTFSGNVMVGFPVGIFVTKEGFGMGAPLPEGLAKLIIK